MVKNIASKKFVKDEEENTRLIKKMRKKKKKRTKIKRIPKRSLEIYFTLGFS